MSHKEWLFRQLRRSSTESWVEFYNRVRAAAIMCDFNTSTVSPFDRAVMMQCLIGDHNEYIRSVALKENNLTPEGLFELATTIDITPKQETHSMCNHLPQDIWLHVFSFLRVSDLLIAEQVCGSWKELVDKILRSRQILHITNCGLDKLQLFQLIRVFRQYGWCLRKLIFEDDYKLGSPGGPLNMLGTWCPNLVTLAIYCKKSVSDVILIDLALKCNKLQEVLLSGEHDYNDEGLGFLLLTLQKLKKLTLDCGYRVDWKCFDHLGPMIEELTLRQLTYLPPSIFMNLTTKFKNLRKLDLMELKINDASTFAGFSQKCVNIKELVIKDSPDSPVMNEMLIEISKMLFLEVLWIFTFNAFDDDKIELMCQRGSHLRTLYIMIMEDSLPAFSDAGVRYIIDNCQQLECLKLNRKPKLTDQSLDYIAKYGHLKELGVNHCQQISDRSCINLVTCSPHLEYLDIAGNPQLTEAILLPCLNAVLNRPNKQPLTLDISKSIYRKSTKVVHPRFTVISNQ